MRDGYTSGPLLGWLERRRATRRARSDRHDLMRLGDHMLKDIGITRQEIARSIGRAGGLD
jgi:uncharacterized protein YjiS (DUF1127 family)